MRSSTQKIVHLITNLGGGGTENFLFQVLSRSPSSFSHKVIYLGKDGVNGERIRKLGVPVERANGLFNLYRLLRQEKPDVLHTCLYWGHQVGRIVGRWAKVPFILSSHQSIDVWQQPWHGWMDRWTLPWCDVVDMNSSAAQTVLEKRLRNTPKRPRFVRVDNGVDFNLFKRQDRAAALRFFQLPPDAQVGGTLMRLHPEKGAEKIPAFARALLKDHPKLVLLIGGTGPLENQLKEATRDLGDRLRWLGWQDDAVRFLSALDFFWLSSREESFPQALLEASVMGLPWVATDVGGVHELLEAGASGILAESKSAEGLAAVGRTLIDHLPEKTAQARAAIPSLQSHYSLEVMTRAFYRIVEENNL
jgi:glycosyltransferase involved in cell wall biosynthesis